jgi:hypothetical protein
MGDRERWRAALVATAWLATGGAIAAAPARAAWQEDLAAEIELQRSCKVAYLSHVVERTVDGKRLVMAKAHCEDRRVFDAMRPDELEPFRFNECQPETAQTC